MALSAEQNEKFIVEVHRRLSITIYWCSTTCLVNKIVIEN